MAWSEVSETHVDTDDRSDHLWDNDHITQVRLDHSGLLVRSCLLLCLAEFLDQSHRAAFETALETTAGTGVDELFVEARMGNMRVRAYGR